MPLSPPAFDLLAWDSDLFGFPVARLRSQALRADALPGAVGALRDEGVRLVYAVTAWDEEEARRAIEQAGGLLVDRKVRYRKRIAGAMVFPAQVAAWAGSECTEELESLALECGHLSRFRIDPRVPPHVYPALYRAWIRRSVRGEIASVVLVSRDAEALTGLITLDIDETTAEVGLMAVRGTHRRRGIGAHLMQAAEAWAHGRGAETLEVVTQGANTGACALYEVSGSRVAREEAIYHLWLEPAR